MKRILFAITMLSLPLMAAAQPKLTEKDMSAYLFTFFNDSIFDQYPYWIAHYYVDSLEYQGPWKFWQHTDVGRLPGIKGNVDFNIYNGSYYDLRQMTIGSQETIGEKAYSE